MNKLRNELHERYHGDLKTVEITRTPLLSTRGEGDPNTDPADLLKEVQAHITAVQSLSNTLAEELKEQAKNHDATKHEHLKDYTKDYSTRGDGKAHWWSEVHNQTERHHLPDTIDDLTIVDLAEHICDTVAAGLARDGVYKPERLDPELLQRIVDNTAQHLINITKVTN